MQRLKSALKDCLAAFLLLVLFRPFGIGGDKNPFVAIAGVVVLVFISSVLSSDRILPVSKANVTIFREKIKDIGKHLG